MEKEVKANKKKLMKYLPRALTFQNPRLSPRGEPNPPRLSDAYKNRAHAGQNRGFSGPLVSLVPIEARSYNNKKVREGKMERRGGGGGFDSDVEEPRSPKVSCIGQIKKKKKKKLHELKREKSKKIERLEARPVGKVVKMNSNSSFGNIFRRKSKQDTEAAKPPPGLNQMKRFSSGRDAFANFDWTKQQVAPMVDRECYSDDDEQRRSDWDDDEEEEGNEVIIPFSAPMMIGGGDVIKLEPRKEICLWKKRNMPPPKPLKLYTFK